MKQKSHKAPQERRRPALSLPAFAIILLLGCLAAGGIWLAWPFGSATVRGPHSVTADDHPGAAATTGDSSGSANQAVARIDSRQKTELAELDDPNRDGWESEAFAQAAQRQLERLGRTLTGAAPLSRDELSALAGDNIRCGELRPAELDPVFRDDGLTVFRRSATSAATSEQFSGIDGLLRALDTLKRPLDGMQQAHVHFKVVQVDAADDGVADDGAADDDGQGSRVTRVRYEAAGHSQREAVGQRALWRCEWTEDATRSPRLAGVSVQDYEEVVRRGEPPQMFADCTAPVLAATESFGEQLIYGLNHWLSRLDVSLGTDDFTRYGLAIGDVNGDGLDDVYLCQPGGLPNRLLVQNPEGTVRDASQASGVDWLDTSSSALLVDWDNDGDQDLAVAMQYRIVLMSNDGAGQFTESAVLPVRDFDLQSLSAADFDNDGDLDLYVCVDFATPPADRQTPATPFVYHDANDGGANVLYRNDIQPERPWHFTDVTGETGLDTDNRRHSLAASWEDFDADGNVDLYVANDYGRNCLYRNNGGRFTNVAAAAGVEDYGSGMSVAWGDTNRDGRMDLYVANMFSSAGSRITRQEAFKPDTPNEVRQLYRRFAKGNTLFTNLGDGSFRDDGQAAGVEMGRWAWASPLVDLNNDGWEDVVVANGYITTDDAGDL